MFTIQKIMDVSNSCLVTKPLQHIVILVRFTTAGFQLLFQDHWKVLWSFSVIPLSRFVIVFKLSWNLWPKGNVDHGLGAQTGVEIYSFPLWGEAVAVTWPSGSCPFRRIGGGAIFSLPRDLSRLCQGLGNTGQPCRSLAELPMTENKGRFSEAIEVEVWLCAAAFAR